MTLKASPSRRGRTTQVGKQGVGSCDAMTTALTTTRTAISDCEHPLAAVYARSFAVTGAIVRPEKRKVGGSALAPDDARVVGEARLSVAAPRGCRVLSSRDTDWPGVRGELSS